MPPQQPVVSSPSPTGKYDFFLNPQTQNSKRFGVFRSTHQLMVVLIGLVVIGVIIIILGHFFGGNNIPVADFTALTVDQGEMAHISTQAVQDAQGQPAKNLASSAELSLLSAQQSLANYAATNGHTIKANFQSTPATKTTDQTLTTALAASNFDAIYVQTMQSQLQQYTTDLKTVFNATPGVKGRTLLHEQYQAAQLLLTVANGAATISSQ